MTWHQRRRCLSWPARDSPFWRFYSLFITVFSLLLLVATIATTTKPYDDACEPQDQTRPESPLAGYPHQSDSWKPSNLVEKRFFRDLRYMTIDHESDYLWKEHLFMATGNIRLPDDDAGGNTSLKGIAMYHQMHCLAKMRMVLQLAKEGTDIGTDWRDDAHWPHCFDYLRESIMCYADPTLESVSLQPGPLNNGKFVKVIDGGAETRYCRNTRPLEELVRRYGPNSQYGFAKDDFEVAPGK
ncbi:hypothetical protein EK21DRAFT_61142 [Setomelanomma holmii]|uniref:Oxidase ustYa n=1 Tax=Setomelanomma holmii TaxID=210430 RepID=A0A9P4HEX4_9PLEO|nr:hypothetical protein EK21DRAFT_61142 [Setomelanomma holmii]